MNICKTILPALLLAPATMQAQEPAQPLTMAGVFSEMPDSLLPYLSHNDRLDMIDFLEAHMKAEVTNRLDGKSELLVLTADSLALRMSTVMQVDMKLTPTTIVLWRTYRINEKQAVRTREVYSTAWECLQPAAVEQSSLRWRDEQLLQLPQF